MPVDEQDQILWAMAERLVDGDLNACDALFHTLAAPMPALAWNPDNKGMDQDYLSQVLNWWLVQKGNAAMPSPGTIDPVGLRGLLGNLMILEPIDEGQDFYMRLYGSNVTPHSHHDLTGQKVSEIWTPLRDYFLVNYRAVYHRRESLYSLHTPPVQINFSAWKRLILPFGDGQTVTRLVVGICPTERQE